MTPAQIWTQFEQWKHTVWYDTPITEGVFGVCITIAFIILLVYLWQWSDQ